ncbi:uncharacterized protein LOC144152867 [Haemaphysalis longicornis]
MARPSDTPPRFDVALKLRVVEYYEKVRSKHAAAKMFGVSECSVRNWIKTEHRLRAQGSANKSSLGAGALLEACMQRYVQTCQQRGVKAKYRDLLAHAAQLKKALRVRGLALSLDWVAQFVRERKLVGKCEKLTAAKGLSSSVKSGSATAAAAAQSLRRAKGQLSSVKARGEASTRKAKLPVKKSSKAKSSDGKAIASKGKLVNKVGGKSSPTRKALSAEEKAPKKQKPKSTSAAGKAKAPKKQKPKSTSAAGKAFVSVAKNKKAKATAAGKKRASMKAGTKTALSKAKSAKSAAIIAKYKRNVLKKASQAQRKLKNKSTRPVKKKGQVQTKTKHKQQVANKAAKLQKLNQSKDPKAARKVAVAKKDVTVKAQKQAKILNKVVSRSLKKAAKIVNRAQKPVGDADLSTKQPVQRVRQVPLKRLRPRKQPVKVFRTRYRIKEMHRRIEESRASDFFDFFYGLGLVPINRDSDNPLCISLVTNSPKFYGNPGFICDVPKTESPFRPGTSNLGSSHGQLPPRFPIWTPMRTTTGHESSPSKSGKSRHTSPRMREEHIISDRFPQAESPEDSVFFEKLHKASIQSEGALSPGESPIMPEQLAVVRKLFPAPIGRGLAFPALDSPVTFSGPPPARSPERKLRPRTPEQAKRLSLCFRKRRYQKRKRTLSEPSRSPDKRPHGPAASDIDWLSADGLQSAAKRSCPSGSHSPVYSFVETGPCFCKEHFEDALGKHSAKDRLWGHPGSPTATSSGEGKELFFGQALRLATLRKKLDKGESVMMHAAKGPL